MNLRKPNYHAWLIDEKDFPRDGTIKQKIEFLTGYGILAPSQHNTQPWTFGVGRDDVLTIKPDMSRILPVGDPNNRGLYIALGACVENLIEAGEQFGLSGIVTSEDGTVHIKFTESKPTGSNATDHITRRYSDKSLYSKKPIDESAVDKLRQITSKTTELRLVVSDEELNKVIRVHTAAAAEVADNPAFVRELAEWLRPNKTRSFDGMPGFVSGVPSVKSIVAIPLLKKKPQLFKKALSQDEKLFDSASMVAVWGVENNTPNDFINCGRLIERFWLKAVELGLAAHPMAASVSSESASKELARALGMKTTPVFLMRVGCHDDMGLRTPRRSAVCN